MLWTRSERKRGCKSANREASIQWSGNREVLNNDERRTCSPKGLHHIDAQNCISTVVDKADGQGKINLMMLRPTIILNFSNCISMIFIYFLCFVAQRLHSKTLLSHSTLTSNAKCPPINIFLHPLHVVYSHSPPSNQKEGYAKQRLV
jgi:hypothetical protein